MLRVIEILFFVAPLALFLGWRLLAPDAPLTRSMVATAVAVLLLLAASLLWLRWEAAEPGDTVYVPSRLQDGHITPPDAVKR